MPTPIKAAFVAHDTGASRVFGWMAELMSTVHEWETQQFCGNGRSLMFLYGDQLTESVSEADLLVVGCDDELSVSEVLPAMRAARNHSVPIVLFAGNQHIWQQLRHTDVRYAVQLLVVLTEAEVEVAQEMLCDIRVIHGADAFTVQQELAALLPTDDPTV